ncbi:hypothetical protein Tco_0985888 [Tanacetum coccineum]
MHRAIGHRWNPKEQVVCLAVYLASKCEVRHGKPCPYAFVFLPPTNNYSFKGCENWVRILEVCLDYWIDENKKFGLCLQLEISADYVRGLSSLPDDLIHKILLKGCDMTTFHADAAVRNSGKLSKKIPWTGKEERK